MSGTEDWNFVVGSIFRQRSDNIRRLEFMRTVLDVQSNFMNETAKGVILQLERLW